MIMIESVRDSCARLPLCSLWPIAHKTIVIMVRNEANRSGRVGCLKIAGRSEANRQKAELLARIPYSIILIYLRSTYESSKPSSSVISLCHFNIICFHNFRSTLLAYTRKSRAENCVFGFSSSSCTIYFAFDV